jgi:hypothetical protein
LAARQQKVGRREFNNRLNRDRTFAKRHAYNGSHVSFWAENMHGYSQIGSYFSHYAVGNKQNMLLLINVFQIKRKEKKLTEVPPGSWVQLGEQRRKPYDPPIWSDTVTEP